MSSQAHWTTLTDEQKRQEAAIALLALRAAEYILPDARHQSRRIMSLPPIATLSSDEGKYRGDSDDETQSEEEFCVVPATFSPGQQYAANHPRVPFLEIIRSTSSAVTQSSTASEDVSQPRVEAGKGLPPSKRPTLRRRYPLTKKPRKGGKKRRTKSVAEKPKENKENRPPAGSSASEGTDAIYQPPPAKRPRRLIASSDRVLRPKKSLAIIPVQDAPQPGGSDSVEPVEPAISFPPAQLVISAEETVLNTSENPQIRIIPSPSLKRKRD
ncbi:hypothetical protein BDZ97DRAFT_1764436 [Flammula alnicola]|nr:hypothetical protein BDZ97DRAFT_1764436 [Flammula alnicola]